MAARQALPGLPGLYHYDLIEAIKWRKVYSDSMWELEAAGHIPPQSGS